MGEITVICDQGDVQITWDPDSAESVENAKKEWASLKEAGFEFFKKHGQGKPKRIQRFVKSLGEVLASPGIATPADKKAGTRSKAMAGGPDPRPVGRQLVSLAEVGVTPNPRVYPGDDLSFFRS